MELRHLPASTGRGARQCGVYELHHPRTGVFIVGYSSDLYAKRASHLCELRSGTHKNDRLQIVYNQHSVVEFHWEPTEDLTSAKQRVAALFSKYYGDELLANGRGAATPKLRTPAISFAFAWPVGGAL